jgi:hypothetical protein
MTWVHIPSSTVSAGTAASPSASDSPTPITTSGRSPISNGTHIANESSRPGLRTATSMTLPSGEETSGNFAGSPGVESWISSLHHFLANHSQMLENGRGNSILKGGTSGPIPSESLGKWHQGPESCWRTSQASLFDLTMDGKHMAAPWLESWPKQGMTRNGALYPLPTQERHISETGGGSWPTPDTMNHRDGANMRSAAHGRHAMSLHHAVEAAKTGKWPTRWMTPNTMDSLPAKSQKALDHEHETARPGASNPNNLRDQVAVSEGQTMWPTPRGEGTRVIENPETARARMDRLKAEGRQTGGIRNLEAEARMLPTPNEADGSLSPDWVSWLMGLPVGWTSLEPLPREEYLDWVQAQMDGTWWQEERGLPRIATGIPDRVDRLKCLGNGIVPASLALFLRGTT